MTRREAKRIALLIVWDEIGRSLDVSSEWERHPESDKLFTKEEVEKVKREAKAFLDSLETRIGRAEKPSQPAPTSAGPCLACNSYFCDHRSPPKDEVR